MHLKIVHAFVESVLLYGLPAEFVSFFTIHDARHEKDIKTKLTKAVLNARPELRPKRGALLDEEEEGEDAESSMPFVCLKFPMVGTV